MESTHPSISVETIVKAPIDQVWKFWTTPAHIMKWNNATDEWHTPNAENDLRVGGHFLSRMEAKDGSFGFDFSGVYDQVDAHQLIAYTLADGRKVKVVFEQNGANTKIAETFDAEGTNPVEMQRQGWQAILDNFKRYVEDHSSKKD